jgi:hypothetical protein
LPCPIKCRRCRQDAHNTQEDGALHFDPLQAHLQVPLWLSAPASKS